MEQADRPGPRQIRTTDREKEEDDEEEELEEEEDRRRKRRSSNEEEEKTSHKIPEPRHLPGWRGAEKPAG